MSAEAASKEFHYPLFARSDYSAFWALFTDNFTNLLVISGVLMLFPGQAYAGVGQILDIKYTEAQWIIEQPQRGA